MRRTISAPNRREDLRYPHPEQGGSKRETAKDREEKLRACSRVVREEAKIGPIYLSGSRLLGEGEETKKLLGV